MKQVASLRLALGRRSGNALCLLLSLAKRIRQDGYQLPPMTHLRHSRDSARKKAPGLGHRGFSLPPGD
jgi:hypothetical protein